MRRRAAVLCAAAVLSLWLFSSCGRSRPAGPRPSPEQAGDSLPRVRDPRLQDVRNLIRQARWPEALRSLEEGKRRGASPAEALALQAEIFRATDYLDREIETLREWAAAAPDQAEPSLRLFYIYLDLGWRHEAGEMSRRALTIDPANVSANTARAIYFYRSPEPAEGLPFVQRARKLDPDNPELANLHGTILLKAFKTAEAEKVLAEAVRRWPDHKQNRLALAEALSRLKRPKEAEETLRTVLQQDPDNVEARLQMGILAEKRGDYAAAREHYESGIARDAAYGSLLFRLGNLYRRQGLAEKGRQMLADYKRMAANADALETLLLRVSKLPNDPAVHRQLARARLEEGDLPKAIVELRRVVALAPRDLEARMELARTLDQHGRATEARSLASAGAGTKSP